MKKEIIPVQQMAQAIRFVRGGRVLRDFDLARLYGVIEVIWQLAAPPEKPRLEIGFHVREKAPPYRTRKRQ